VPSTFYTVNTTSGSAAGSLPYVATIDADATSPVIVNFDPTVFSGPETIALSTPITLSNTGEPIYINGGDIVGPITITGGPTINIFQVGSNVTATIANVTLSDGSVAGFGGGISNAGSLSLIDCTISGCTANNGAAIANYSGATVTVIGSTISGNTAIDGGAVENSGTMQIVNSILSGNSADVGGALYNSGSLSVLGSTISGNTAVQGGGVMNSGILTVCDSTISGNTAVDYGGGAIYNFGGTLTLSDSTLLSNSAANGGAICNIEGTATIDNCNLLANSANTDGGGVYNDLGTLSVSDSSISGNWAGGNGGGVWNYGSISLTATNR